MLFDAIVLAGGASRRLGGVDKAALVVGGRTLLDRVLGACVSAGRVVVVGPARPTSAEVVWCREEPVGGGPVPALAAGLSEISASVVVTLACDLPHVTSSAIRHLVEAVPPYQDGAIFVDDHGRDQPLVGAYRRESLVRALAGREPPYAGVALRSLIERLELRRLPDQDGVTRDCDTWDDVELARHPENMKGPFRR